MQKVLLLLPAAAAAAAVASPALLAVCGKLRCMRCGLTRDVLEVSLAVWG